MATQIGKANMTVKRDQSYDGKPVLDYNVGVITASAGALVADTFTEVYLLEPKVAAIGLSIKFSGTDDMVAATSLRVGIGDSFNGGSDAFETGTRAATAANTDMDVLAADGLTGKWVDLSYFGSDNPRAIVVQNDTLLGSTHKGLKFEILVHTGRNTF